MEPIEVADFNGPSDLPCCVCEGEDPRPEQENIPITPFYSAEGSEKTAPTHRDKQRLYTSRQGDTATASAEAKIGSASTSSAAELTTLEGMCLVLTTFTSSPHANCFITAVTFFKQFVKCKSIHFYLEYPDCGALFAYQPSTLAVVYFTLC